MKNLFTILILISISLNTKAIQLSEDNIEKAYCEELKFEILNSMNNINVMNSTTKVLDKYRYNQEKILRDSTIYKNICVSD